MDIRVTSEDQPRQQLGNTLSDVFASMRAPEDELMTSSIRNAPWGGVIKTPFVDNHKQKRSPCHFEVVYDTATGAFGVETAQELRGAAYKKRLAASLRDSVDMNGSVSATDDGSKGSLDKADSSADKLLGQIFLITEVLLWPHALVS